MATETDIANMALSHIKVGKRLGNLRSDVGPEAVACRTFFDIAVEQVLRELHWPFAKRIAALDLVQQNPNTEWGYSYRRPSGCVKFTKILSSTRIPSNSSAIAFAIGSDSSGGLIYTDQGVAFGEWTASIPDISLWPADVALALSYLVASLIAPSLTGSDPYKAGAAARQNYEAQVMVAKCAALNEEQRDFQYTSDSLDARNN